LYFVFVVVAMTAVVIAKLVVVASCASSPGLSSAALAAVVTIAGRARADLGIGVDVTPLTIVAVEGGPSGRRQ
jgi:hypothetical protein